MISKYKSLATKHISCMHIQVSLFLLYIPQNTHQEPLHQEPGHEAIPTLSDGMCMLDFTNLGLY